MRRARRISAKSLDGDAAMILTELVERVEATELAADIEGGDVLVADGLDKFVIKRRDGDESDRPG
jgi:hypothetical protein